MVCRNGTSHLAEIVVLPMLTLMLAISVTVLYKYITLINCFKNMEYFFQAGINPIVFGVDS